MGRGLPVTSMGRGQERPSPCPHTGIWTGLGWGSSALGCLLRSEELGYPKGKGGDEPSQQLHADPQAADQGGGPAPRLPGSPPFVGPQVP